MRISVAPALPCPLCPESADFFEGCKQFCATGRALLVTLKSEGLEESTLERLRVIGNANLMLQTREVDDRPTMVLEVTKIRNAAPASASSLGFVVEPLQGITAVPLPRNKE